MPEVANGTDSRANVKRLVSTRRRWLVAGGLVVALLVAALAVGVIAALPPIGGPDLSKLDQGALETEKLRQEVRALQLENASGDSLLSRTLSLLPVVTVALGVLGLTATVWRQLDERAEQRRQEAIEAKREDVRRFDEGFAKVVEHLGSDSPALQASAVVSLTFLLTPEYEQFHDRVLLLAVATAKSGIEYSPAVGRLFVDTIEQAVRVKLAKAVAGAPSDPLDLSRVKLDGIDLSKLDLTEADLAFASLHHANLTESTLYRVRGFKVDLSDARLSRADLREARLNSAIAPNAQFHGANCVSARLEHAVLTGAQFYQARLQEVHFDDADLTGARFEGANLNNAYLTGAVFDASALDSIATGAQNWRKARFDPDVMTLLRGKGDRARPAPDAPPQTGPTDTAGDVGVE